MSSAPCGRLWRGLADLAGHGLPRGGGVGGKSAVPQCLIVDHGVVEVLVVVVVALGVAGVGGTVGLIRVPAEALVYPLHPALPVAELHVLRPAPRRLGRSLW